MLPTGVGSGHRYRPSELLSEDELGTLWRGTDVWHGSPVTVRLLDERLTSDPQAVHRATIQLRWAQWSASNPHLARVLDHNLWRLAEPPVFVVAEGCGGPLMRHLETSALSVRDALRVTAAVADGLASAHAAWVSHGALTSASVLVDDDAVAKVTDIGLGELLGDRDGRGRSSGMASLSDRRAADVLAVGLLLEELVSPAHGRPPGIDGDAAPAWEDEVPPGMRVLVRRALSPYPLERPDMDELAAGLAPALASTWPAHPWAPRRARPTEPPPYVRSRPGRPLEQGPSHQARPEPRGAERVPQPPAPGLGVGLPSGGPAATSERPAGGPEVEAEIPRSGKDVSSKPDGGSRGVIESPPGMPDPARPAAAAAEEGGRVAARGRPQARGRRRLLVTLAASLVVVVGGVAGAFAILDADAPVERPLERQPSVSVSPENEPATVPVVLGRRVERVALLLDRAGLAVGSVTTVSGRAGIVVRTDPTQGEAVAAGTEVDLFVGSGVDD